MDTPDNPENNLPAEDIAEDSNSAHESLLQFVTSVLVLTIVVSGTLNILLLRLWKNSRDDLRMFRPQAQNIIVTYQKGDGPVVDKIVKKLMDFGATNPDYVPILTKHGLKPTAPAGASAPVSAPPATSAPPKK